MKIAASEKSTVAAYVDWRDRQHKARQAGPKEDVGQALFDSLNLYCQSHLLVDQCSRPASGFDRSSGSNVMQDLAGMGFKVSPAGSGARLVPVATQTNIEANRYKAPRLVTHGGEIQTELIEVILPKA